MFLDSLFRRKSSGKLGPSMAPITVTLSYKTHKPWKIEVEDDATVRLVKDFIARQVPGTAPEDLSILFRGRERKDEDRLIDLGVRDGAKLQAAETSASRARKGDPFGGPGGPSTSAQAAATGAAPARPSAERPRASAIRGRGETGAAAAAAAAGAAAPPPRPPPPPPLTPAGRLAVIAGEIDALAAQADAILPPGTVVGGRVPPPEPSTALVVAGPPALPAPPPPPDAAKAALALSELLTQRLIALDGVEVDGDRELRAARKAEINRVNGLCDALDKWRKGGP